MKNLFSILAVLSFLALSASEKPSGILKGKVLTVNSAEPVAYAHVILTNDTTERIFKTTNWEGEYVFATIDTGVWKVTFTARGYQDKTLPKVRIIQDKAIVLNVALTIGQSKMAQNQVQKSPDATNSSIPDETGTSSANVPIINSIEINEVVISYVKPLFEKDQTTVGTSTSRSEIESMAVRSIPDISRSHGGAISGYTYYRGSQDAGSLSFFNGSTVIGRIYNYPSRKKRKKYVAPPKTKEEIRLEQAEEVVYFENELYEEIADNTFESTLKAPLSTFSIDVDKAAYANARRFINQGMLPPANAIRIEEMINYFNYDYPQPEDEHPFSITTELTVCPWNNDRKLALIGIQGEKVEMEEAPVNNLVLLVDVSGSMSSPNKLGLLKKGLGLLIDKLRNDDRLAIVVYAGAAGVVLKSTPGTNKEQIKQVLNKLSAGGSTAGGQGIQLAYKIAQKNFIIGGNNRVILATDGDFNVGVSSQEGLVKLIEKKRESGVFLSVLGLGTGNYQDNKMEQLANKGNGNYNYIDNILEAKKVLVKEMGGTLYTIAKDVKVQAEFNPLNVKAYRLIGYVNRALADKDFNDDTKDAGELGSGHTVTVLYEIIPANSDEEFEDIDSLKYQVKKPVGEMLIDELLTVKFRYKAPQGSTSELITKVMKDEVKPIEEGSNNLQFASAVAAFGMKLRNSESAKNVNYTSIITQARNAKGKDEEGYRAEFVQLVEKVELMK